MDEATLFRVEELGDLDVLRANYERYSFPEHCHPELVVAVTDRGCASFRYRGSFHAAGRDAVLVHHPGEPHSGGPAGTAGWSYRAMYVSEGLFHRLTGCASLPFFGDEVIDDPVLANRLRRFHDSLENPSTRLTRESWLIEALSWLYRRHGDRSVNRTAVLHDESASVRLAREFLHAHLDCDVSAMALADAAGISPYHLIRMFRQQVGLTPHAYQLSIRVSRAKELLRTGVRVAEVSLATGFYDQAHFTKVFKSQVGVTPHRYAVA